MTARESGGAATAPLDATGGKGVGNANSSNGASAQGGSPDSAFTQAGAAGTAQDIPCDIGALQLAIERASVHGGNGSCYVSWNAAASDTYGNPWGAIVIDSEGRVMGATGPAKGIESKLVERRVTCYAGQILLYWCYGIH